MTMYQNKLVCSVKSNGKVLREFKDTVFLPFGSEYSLLLKNLHTTRALINVFIDGDNIVPGGLVLNAGQELDLERAIRNGNLSVGNKLKFIERTSKIEEHRGIKLEDGLIRVEFQFEKIYTYSPPTWIAPITPITPVNPVPPYWTSGSGIHTSGTLMGMAESYSSCINNMSMGTVSGSLASSQACNATYNNASSQNEAGITVDGSKSEQKFTTVSKFTCESEKHSIVLKLLGETAENKQIREPVTVKAKATCSTCGRVNKATSRFCSECGTSLTIFA